MIDISIARIARGHVFGQIVELAETERLFANPLHPYTKLCSRCSRGPAEAERIILKGNVPTPVDPPAAAVLFPLLPGREEPRLSVRPQLREVEQGHYVACHYAAFQSPFLQRGVG